MGPLSAPRFFNWDFLELEEQFRQEAERARAERIMAKVGLLPTDTGMDWGQLAQDMGLGTAGGATGAALGAPFGPVGMALGGLAGSQLAALAGRYAQGHEDPLGATSYGDVRDVLDSELPWQERVAAGAGLAADALDMTRSGAGRALRREAMSRRGARNYGEALQVRDPLNPGKNVRDIAALGPRRLVPLGSVEPNWIEPIQRWRGTSQPIDPRVQLDFNEAAVHDVFSRLRKGGMSWQDAVEHMKMALSRDAEFFPGGPRPPAPDGTVRVDRPSLRFTYDLPIPQGANRGQEWVRVEAVLNPEELRRGRLVVENMTTLSRSKMHPKWRYGHKMTQAVTSGQLPDFPDVQAEPLSLVDEYVRRMKLLP